MTKKTRTCPQCGSSDVYKDAAAGWNTETQAWELVSIHDCETCADCGREGDWLTTRDDWQITDAA